MGTREVCLNCENPSVPPDKVNKADTFLIALVGSRNMPTDWAAVPKATIYKNSHFILGEVEIRSADPILNVQLPSVEARPDES